ncbi:hypothetical protein [Methylobacterium fujisawaense]|uniref:hypothetical protein n=1 Tax=Methylobacterium fujisawaense TaxID=107400 RepID=UPI00313AF075
MAAENVSRFNGQVLRAIALLYESHPRRYRLAHEDLTPASAGGATNDDVEFAAGTLKWLSDNGYVSGEFLPAVGELDDVQLTAYAWRVLQSTEPNTSTQPLGEAVKQAAAATGRDFDVVAELLVRRLGGG